jgi:hypothetical protein
MEQSSTSLDYGEIPLNKPNSRPDKDKKDKKDTKTRFGEYIWREAKEAPSPKLEPLRLARKENEQKPEQAKKTTLPEFKIPNADEAWAGIEQRLQVDPELPKATEAVQHQPEVPIPVTELPLDEGGIHELPLEAMKIHHRLQLETIELKPKDKASQAEKPPIELPKAQAPQLPAPERSEVSPHPEAAAAEGGGNNFEPPLPPPSQERPMGSPEPARPAIPETPQAVETASRWEPESHASRLVGAVPVSELAPAGVASGGTHVIERVGHGESLALVVGIIDWWRGRRIRRELRRGQKRQDKQITTLKKQATQHAQNYERQLQSQKSTNERLRDQLETVSRQASKSEQHTKNLRAEQARLTNTKEAAIAEAAIEQVVELPPEHHIEKSVWHNIEVDKTGRAVERPVFNYGHEFQYEQHQEARADAVHQALAATGQLAVDNATQSSATPPTASSAHGLQIPTSMREETKPKQPGPQLVKTLQRPWVLVVLIVVFFVVAALLILG